MCSYCDFNNNLVEDIIVENNEIQFEDSNIFVNLNFDNKIINLDLDEYVVGVVSCEMPASFDDNALKAMSVAARTFALYKINSNKNYILNSDVSDQCYISIEQMKLKWGNDFNKYYNKILNLVKETKNEYMTYNDEIVLSFYFSISNGFTENVENVFSQKLDYLVSVDSSWDSNYDYKSYDLKMNLSDFYSKLNLKYSNDLEIKYQRNDSGRVSNIYINNVKFKGTKFRSLLSLRSTDIEIIHDNDFVYIKTKGYGHGVGMSQYGANYMSLNGYDYKDILKYYYTGVDIVNKI
jgi:stage II sporulation protein D